MKLKAVRSTRDRWPQALRTFDVYDMTAFAAVVDTGMHPPERIHAYRKKAEASRAGSPGSRRAVRAACRHKSTSER
jgi:hypothetical protein